MTTTHCPLCNDEVADVREHLSGVHKRSPYEIAELMARAMPGDRVSLNLEAVLQRGVPDANHEVIAEDCKVAFTSTSEPKPNCCEVFSTVEPKGKWHTKECPTMRRQHGVNGMWVSSRGWVPFRAELERDTNHVCDDNCGGALWPQQPLTPIPSAPKDDLGFYRGFSIGGKILPVEELELKPKTEVHRSATIAVANAEEFVEMIDQEINRVFGLPPKR